MVRMTERLGVVTSGKWKNKTKTPSIFFVFLRQRLCLQKCGVKLWNSDYYLSKLFP